MEVTYIVDKEKVLKEVRRLTTYVGQRKGEDGAFERISATDSDREMLEQFWQAACSSATEELMHYAIDIYIGSVCRESEYEVEMDMPSMYDDNLNESVESSLQNFFVNLITSKWCKITNPDDEAKYAAEALGFIRDIDNKIYQRKRPTRENAYNERACQGSTIVPVYGNSYYKKPKGGIPKTDLAEDVRKSLSNADTAIQEVKTINNQSIIGEGNITIKGGGGDVESVNGKTGVVVLDANDVGAATFVQGAKADTAIQEVKTINGNSLVGSGDILISAETYVIDEAPTEDSDNLVTSGGVYGFLPSVPMGDYATAKQMTIDNPFKNFQYLLVSPDFVKPVWHYRGKLLDAVGANVNLDTPDLFVFKIKLLADDDTLSLSTASGNYDIDWGDESEIEHITGSSSHQYVGGESGDIYTVTISGYLPYFLTNQNDNFKARVVSIDMNTLTCQTIFTTGVGNGLNLSYNGSNLISLSHDALQSMPVNKKNGITFQWCNKLKYLPEYMFDDWTLSGDLWAIFYNCWSLKRLPISLRHAIRNCTGFTSTFEGACSSLGDKGFDYTLFDDIEDGTVTSFSSTFKNFGSSADKIDAYILYQKMLPKCAQTCDTSNCFYSSGFKNRDLVPTSWGGTLSE